MLGREPQGGQQGPCWLWCSWLSEGNFHFFSPWFVVASFKYPSVSDKFLEAQRDRFQVPEGSRSGESEGILGFNQGSSSFKNLQWEQDRHFNCVLGLKRWGALAHPLQVCDDQQT